MNISEFQQKIAGNPKPIVIEFWAPWCAPCQMTKPVLHKLAKEYGEKVDFLPDCVRGASRREGSPGPAMRYNRGMSHGVPLVIGIAGGSGSGKTTVAQVILNRVGADRIAYIQHDSYYKDLTGLPPTQRAEVNFDHPHSLETELLIGHIKDLRAGRAVEVPVYDFASDSRTAETFTVSPQRVIIVEGILIFAEAELRKLLDVKIFVDTDPDLRLIRRLQRDIAERGRTTESVIKRYLATVRPMHLEFVEPSKRYADVIIPEGGFNTAALDMVVARIEALLM